jgi:hypothetical protein
MVKKLPILLAIMALFFSSLACQLVTGAQETAEPVEATSVLAPRATEAQVIEPTATEDLAATQQAEENSAVATQEAADLATAEAFIAEATQQAEEILAQTAVVEVAATALAENMYSDILQLQSDGVLQNTEGQYYIVDDFEESWAQINWYQWWRTGLQPTNFVVRAHTEWESASRTANWFDSGCGFVFRETDEDNHYVIFLALDGNVYMKGYVEGKYRELGREYYGKLDFMNGEADVVLVVEGDHIVYFINGEKIFERNHNYLDSGNLDLTLVSGTNKDFGTRCEITDIEVWALDE